MDSSTRGQEFVALCSSFVATLAATDLVYLLAKQKYCLSLFSGTRKFKGKCAAISISLAIVLLVVLNTSAAMILFCMCLGPFVGWSEDWKLGLGIEYMIGNTLGLVQPLTSVTPDEQLSIVLTVAVSIMGLLVVTLALAVGSSIVEALRPWAYYPTVRNLMMWLFLLIPFTLLGFSLVLGSIQAAVEGWQLRDGVYFMLAQLIGAANPFISNAPKTAFGCFVEVLCVGLQIAMQSLILDLVFQHPLLQGLGASGARSTVQLLQTSAGFSSNEIQTLENSHDSSPQANHSGIARGATLEEQAKSLEEEIAQREARLEAIRKAMQLGQEALVCVTPLQNLD